MGLENPPLQPFPHYIKQWREFRGLTQQETADAMGMTKVNISRIENFHRGYTQETLNGFSAVLDCEPSDLLGPPPVINTAPILKRMAEKGLDVLGLSSALRLPDITVKKFLNGKERLTFDEAKDFARVLGMALEDVLLAFGIEYANPDQFLARLNGYIVDGDTVQNLTFIGGIDEIPVPFAGWHGLCLMVNTPNLAPRFMPGECLGFGSPFHFDLPDIENWYGREVIAMFAHAPPGQDDLTFYFKRLQAGSERQAVTLSSLNSQIPPLVNVKPAYIAPLEWHVTQNMMSIPQDQKFWATRSHRDSVAVFQRSIVENQIRRKMENSEVRKKS